MFFKNKLLSLLNRKSLVDENSLTDLVEKIIKETKIVPVKPTNIVDQYDVDETINIYINDRNGIYEYLVVEPDYDDETIHAVSRIYLENPTCGDAVCIEETLSKIGDEHLYRVFSKQPINIIYYYRKISSGYGALYPLIRDGLIEEIAASSDDQYISIIHRKYSWYGWMNTNILINQEAMDRIVLSLARRIGRHLSIAYPLAEGLTNDGLRISLTYGREVSRKGSSLVIRKKPPNPWTITKLIDAKTLSSLIASYLWLVMELRGSIMIVGGVSSGKTTLLQALLTLIPPTRRVVTIEDTPEITGSTGYWDPLVERTTGLGDSLSIDMSMLLKFSLRRRIDYLVVGEVRGVEARLLIQASRLGHGVLTTIHADDGEKALERLYSPPISIPRNLLTNIWCIVVMENDNGFRRVKGVYEVDDKLKLLNIFRYGEDGYQPHDPVAVAKSSYRLRKLLDEETLSQELADRMVYLDKLVSNGVFEINVLSEELNKYYTEILLEEVVDKVVSNN